MNRFAPHSVGKSATIALSLSAGAVVALFLLFPERIFAASINGLHIWWNVVFPVLLPFWILAEILTAFGAIHWIGCWLRPVMRWVFRLPEAGGWALAAGLAAGYPSGAHATVELRKQGLVDREQGERLLALTHAASPVVIVSVVAVGFFQQPQLGIYLIAVHYAALITLGWLLSIIWHQGPRGPRLPRVKPNCRDALVFARLHDGRGLGQILGDAVTASITRLMQVGGWMMLFAVAAEIMRISGFLGLFGRAARSAFAPFVPAAPPDAWEALLVGAFEVHLGAFRLGQLSGPEPNVALIAMIAAVLAWSGWSLMFQVQHLLRDSDLRWGRFLFARFLHGMLAFLLTPLLWPLFRERMSGVRSVYAPLADGADGGSLWSQWLSFPLWLQPPAAAAFVVAALAAASAVLRALPSKR